MTSFFIYKKKRWKFSNLPAQRPAELIFFLVECRAYCRCYCKTDCRQGVHWNVHFLHRFRLNSVFKGKNKFVSDIYEHFCETEKHLPSLFVVVVCNRKTYRKGKRWDEVGGENRSCYWSLVPVKPSKGKNS